MPGDIVLRALQATDVQAVYDVALAAWHATYKTIYPTEFINNFVQTNYAPAGLLRLIPRIQAGHHFFHVALAHSSVVGFCHIAETRHGDIVPTVVLCITRMILGRAFICAMASRM